MSLSFLFLSSFPETGFEQFTFLLSARSWVPSFTSSSRGVRRGRCGRLGYTSWCPSGQCLRRRPKPDPLPWAWRFPSIAEVAVGVPRVLLCCPLRGLESHGLLLPVLRRGTLEEVPGTPCLGSPQETLTAQEGWGWSWRVYS